ncbi:hypothetical protein [Actinoallomurus rhizosphaericola]|uniref:hypothetical protein n=1 Tax=Actinoallomurus rhizosphaericola TaxID=2952536 RepID=UPI0020931D01|nr:hypothetical protein [Actinoallomurus rhizosphaericola]MCO6000097.1 hypothetical protein [Actinoallomurus rhizosphaericola]
MRAAVFAGVCVVLSLAGHDLMASRPAPLWAGGAAVAGVTAVGYCLADRRRSAWWILLAVEVVQACLHEWFAWATPADPGSALAHPAMTMHGGVHAAVGSGMAVPMNHGAGASGLGMAAAHTLAGALVALWLYAGERAAWRVLDVLAEAVLRPALRVLLLLAHANLLASRRPGGVRRRRGVDQTPPAVAVLRHVLVRRGPPRGIGAVLRAAL